jgi:hypothetical protein
MNRLLNTSGSSFRVWLAAVSAAALALALLTECSGSPSPTPDPRIDQALEKLYRLTEQVRVLESKIDSGTADSAPPPPIETLSATKSLPTPTPNPDNSTWIQQRLGAVITLYNLTGNGTALIQSLDLRQMRGDPGFFGSYGFKKWAGVGEAKPTGVIHEISHSYWGGFPVQGFDELSWEIPKGGGLSTAMERYHADILAFMAQPPDGYELFRQRLRNLPELSSTNLEPLFHNLEADMVYGTGGDLALVPPILRKYWTRFLNPGPFGTWYDAVAWHRSLADQDRADANKYLGFEHLDLRPYDSLSSTKDLPNLIEPRRTTLAEEERQRLFDLADQFDLLLGDPQKEENFQFWRGYLRDKVELHRKHQDHLTSLKLPRAADLAAALDYLTGLAGLSPHDQARRLEERLASQPALVNFFPALENPTLLELFGAVDQLPRGPTFQATASFVERLERFAVDVDQVLEAGRLDPRSGAVELEGFLSEINLEQKEDLRLFFDLLRDEDPATASQVVQALDKDTVRRLMGPVPTQLRFILTSDELLDELDITPEAQVSALKRGVALLIEEPSGNFIIDEPFLDRLYEVIAARSQAEPAVMLQLLQETPFPLEGFIREQPTAAVTLLESDLEAAVRLVRQSDPVLSPPARIIHRIVHTDPVLAASLVQALDQQGEADLAVDSLAYVAYDLSRLTKIPDLPISLEQDGRFLGALLQKLGTVVVTQRLSETFKVFGDRVATSQVSPDFLTQYQATLLAAVATLSDSDVRQKLIKIIEQMALIYSNAG